MIYTKNNNYIDIVIPTKLIINSNIIHLKFNAEIESGSGRIIIPAKHIRVLYNDITSLIPLNKLDCITTIDNCVTTNYPNIRQLYEDTNESKCSICFENPKDTIFYPCSHYYCCNECSNQINNQKCPICNNNIDIAIQSSVIRTGYL